MNRGFGRLAASEMASESPVDQRVRAMAARAAQLLAQGHLAGADTLWRLAIAVGPDHPAFHDGLGRIALALGLQSRARREFDRALALDPGFAPAQQGHAAARAITPRPPAGEQFLLVRAWGCGFWSDVDHVIGQLALAEITGRTPVVYWGPESRFGRREDGNAWERYFEPVSPVTLEDLERRGLDVFPGKWRGRGLRADPGQRWQGPDARLHAIYFLNRGEPLVVSDFHTGLPFVIGWAEPGGPLDGLSPHEAYRAVVRKRLRPRARILDAVERFAGAHLVGRPVLGVHIRATDKVVELRDLPLINAEYPGLIDEHLAARPDAAVFLCTDCEDTMRRYARRYGERLLSTSARRVSGTTGLHLRPDAEPHSLGDEVMIDTYLLTRCDAFIGSGPSNLSCMVTRLRDWPPGAARLIGPNLQEVPNLTAFVPRG